MVTGNTFNKSKILEIACFLNLAISAIPVVDYYCSWMITAIPVIIVVLITIQRKDNVAPMISILFMSLVFAVLQHTFIYRLEEGLISYTIRFMIAFLPCVIAYQVRYTYNNVGFYKRYLQTMAVFTGITSVTTIIGLNKYPMASRELASGTEINDTEHYLAENIGGYDYVYALVILIPLIWYLIKQTRGWSKLLYIAILCVNILCIYESQYTIALILAAISFVLSVGIEHKRVMYFLIVFAVFILCGGYSLFSNLFLYLSKVIRQEYVADRFLQLSQLLSGSEINTNTSADRIEHYENQLSLFFKSPLWGHNLIDFSSDNISGHSLVLDWLGSAGLLGLSVVVLIIVYLFKKIVIFSGVKVSDTVKTIWIVFAILSVLNPVIFPLIITVTFVACSFIQGIEVNSLEIAYLENGS